ncbi:dolichyl-diphosphooligosaccharide--protein glycosyltransferase subunit 2-like [Impatiens glandulifera]|uniref:dolichyl-diphosphooligosaccharide--protein glycosyltransferase subunit 2-like n=1 Tax=Impatiens glandulifera TaxID=253017 RepID=UPI001FB157FA|nr:dolichyl-diphosphooligosaccharide--protein glycosyltransferase subunit 2-like [Impatiens glandulifera]
MARNLAFLVLTLCLTSICNGSIFNPISDAHRSAALKLFTTTDGSFGSLTEAHEAIRTFSILGIEKDLNIRDSTCSSVVHTLESPSSSPKELFYALKVNNALKCEVKEDLFEGIASRLKASIESANSLLDFYYSVGSLLLIKGQNSEIDVLLADANGVFKSIKALSQSDGRWRYSSSNTESSTYAAGIAFETLAGVVSLTTSEIDASLVATLKSDILKLFDSIEKYDDGAYYFDEKLVDARENHGILSVTSSVVRGVTAFASATSGNLNLPGEKILGLANFFLSVIPGTPKELYDQLDALACLESSSVSIPLILSLPATVLSLTRNDQLKVRVSTPLGSSAPSLLVKLVQASHSASKGSSVIEEQELRFDADNDVYILDSLPETVDVGNYIFIFETVLSDSENEKIYATAGRSRVPIYVTGVINVDNAEIAVLDSDLGSVETKKKLDIAGDSLFSLSANHLQKLRLSLKLTTPRGKLFKPHQAFLKLRHESKVEHIFVLENSQKQFELTLDFLGLVDKFFYLSGKYDIQLTVGDSVMDNSFFRELGYIELDLPEAPEKSARPPPQSVDPLSRYGPKAEIAHIFRVPDKRPPQELALAFLGLVLLPFLGFLIGCLRLGVNFKSFPSSTVPASFALLFHLGIAAVLSLYVLFWLKLDLFTTLKVLGLLGIFILFVGQRNLSHLASASSKLKSA